MILRRPMISGLKTSFRSLHKSAPTLWLDTRSSSSSTAASDKPPVKNDTPDVASKLPEERIIPKPYIPLYHHQDPSLFPPLIPGSFPYMWHNLSSAFNAMVSLFTSQEAREKFLSISDVEKEKNYDNKLYGTIINGDVLGQSDMGWIKVLALFDGLNSPLYKDTNFNVTDFMDGAAFAIERFQEVGQGHMKLMTEKVAAAGENNSISYDFIEIAESDPDSLEHDLMQMTTPVYWKMFNETVKELVKAPMFLLELLKKESPTQAKITHLALLSARVASIEKPASLKPDDDDPNAPLEDDSLKPHVESEDSKPQIITQLEVLYESQLTVSSSDDNSEGENSDSVQTRTSVDVATFEACIANDPNGEELRWKLSSTRPALEFGYNGGVLVNTK